MNQDYVVSKFLGAQQIYGKRLMVFSEGNCMLLLDN